MQGPTVSGLRVRTIADAEKIYEAVFRGYLPMVSQRLDPDRRRQITSGQVYVWEERSSNHARSGTSGIERWTDSISWGPSHARDGFLFYDEKEREDIPIYASDSANGLSRLMVLGAASRGLIKQTYSVWVRLNGEYRKWHLTAYSTAWSIDNLYTVDNHPGYPFLCSMDYPPGRYMRARGNPPPGPIHQDSTVVVKLEPILAPLDFLRRVSPHTRHPVDEGAIMSFEIHEILSCY